MKEQNDNNIGSMLAMSGNVRIVKEKGKKQMGRRYVGEMSIGECSIPNIKCTNMHTNVCSHVTITLIP